VSIKAFIDKHPFALLASFFVVSGSLVSGVMGFFYQSSFEGYKTQSEIKHGAQESELRRKIESLAGC